MRDEFRDIQMFRPMWTCRCSQADVHGWRVFVLMFKDMVHYAHCSRWLSIANGRIYCTIMLCSGLIDVFTQLSHMEPWRKADIQNWIENLLRAIPGDGASFSEGRNEPAIIRLFEKNYPVCLDFISIRILYFSSYRSQCRTGFPELLAKTQTKPNFDTGWNIVCSTETIHVVYTCSLPHYPNTTSLCVSLNVHPFDNNFDYKGSLEGLRHKNTNSFFSWGQAMLM